MNDKLQSKNPIACWAAPMDHGVLAIGGSMFISRRGGGHLQPEPAHREVLNEDMPPVEPHKKKPVKIQ